MTDSYVRVDYMDPNGGNHQAELQIGTEDEVRVITIAEYHTGDELGTIFLTDDQREMLKENL